MRSGLQRLLRSEVLPVVTLWHVLKLHNLLQVWTYKQRVAFVLSVTENGMPIHDGVKLQRLQQLLFTMMDSEGNGIVAIKRVRSCCSGKGHSSGLKQSPPEGRGGTVASAQDLKHSLSAAASWFKYCTHCCSLTGQVPAHSRYSKHWAGLRL